MVMQQKTQIRSWSRRLDGNI